MRYPNCTEAVFLARPNRFIARVELEGREETVHVKNTGRCRELLTPGARVVLVHSGNPARRTAWDLVAAWKGTLLVNLDAQAPNALLGEYLPAAPWFHGPVTVRPEYTHGDSRFDFLVTEGERRHLIEVKGVTLEEGGRALFPDAPTERGVKHLRGLTRAMGEGYESRVVFVIQMEGMHAFSPHDRMHPAFGDALRQAAAAGVQVEALGCHVEPEGAWITHSVPVIL